MPTQRVGPKPVHVWVTGTVIALTLASISVGLSLSVLTFKVISVETPPQLAAYGVSILALALLTFWVPRVIENALLARQEAKNAT